MCVHKHSLDSTFLNFDLVYFYRFVNICMFVSKGLVNIDPNEYWRHVSEYFICNGDVFLKGQVLSLLPHHLPNANIFIVL